MELFKILHGYVNIDRSICLRIRKVEELEDTKLSY